MGTLRITMSYPFPPSLLRMSRETMLHTIVWQNSITSVDPNFPDYPLSKSITP